MALAYETQPAERRTRQGLAAVAAVLVPLSGLVLIFALWWAAGLAIKANPNLSAFQGFTIDQTLASFVTLLTSEIPFHTHAFQAVNADGSSGDPSGAVLGKGFYDAGAQTGAAAFYQTTAPNVGMNPQAIGIAGGSLPHNNMMPYLVLNYCIAMQGVFPPRS